MDSFTLSAMQHSTTTSDMLAYDTMLEPSDAVDDGQVAAVCSLLRRQSHTLVAAGWFDDGDAAAGWCDGGCGVDPWHAAAGAASSMCSGAKQLCDVGDGCAAGGAARSDVGQCVVKTAADAGDAATTVAVAVPPAAATCGDALVTSDGVRLSQVLAGATSGEATLFVVDGGGFVAKVFNQPITGRQPCAEVAVRRRVTADGSVALLQHANIVPMPAETTVTRAAAHGVGVSTHTVLVYPRFAGDLLSWPPLLHRVAAGTAQVCDLAYERRVASVIRQVLRAVEAAHAFDVVHLDLKPENVLFTPRVVGGGGGDDDDHDVVVCDFGAARVVPVGHGMHGVYGTTEYQAPAMTAGGVYDPRACDLWGVAAMALVLLVAVTPRRRGELEQYLTVIRAGGMSAYMSPEAQSFLTYASAGCSTARALLYHAWLA